jgi:gamma-glutamyltranspeptidase/glutathione hydrolase
MELRPGTVTGFGKQVDVRLASGARSAVENSGAGEPTVGRIDWTHDEDHLPDVTQRDRERMGAIPGDTVHFDIIDRDGNMVTATPSGGWLHSSPVIPAALMPGKRPRSTLTPTMALRDGEPYLAWGSPGGDQQDQWITQFFLRHVHAKMNLQEAIDAPAWHSEHFPSSFWPRKARPGVMVVESRVPGATVKELRARGHQVEVGPDWSEGRLTAASKLGRRRRAAANPRGMQGYAAGR